VLVIEDADFDGLFCEPANEGVDFFQRVYPVLLECIGGDATSERRLYGYFRQAGIADPHLSVVQLLHAVGEAKAIRSPYAGLSKGGVSIVCDWRAQRVSGTVTRASHRKAGLR
jgi:hypothetical protein